MQRTGIRERHIVDPGVATSDLAKEAALAAIAKAGLTPDDIDMIIVGTVTPDMLFPSTACLVQAQDRRAQGLGLRSLGGVLGVHLLADRRQSDDRRRRRQACAGDRRRRDVEHHRLHRSRDLRAVRRRRGRGGARPVATTDYRHPRLRAQVDGSGGPALCMPAGGSRCPASHETVDQRLHYVKQDGQTVFKFAVRNTGDVCERLLQRNNLTRRRHRSVRLAPGEPAHHHVGGRTDRAARREGRSSTSSGSATRPPRRSRSRSTMRSNPAS